MAVKIGVYPLGPLQVNTCVIRCGRECAIVDPTCGAGRIVREQLEAGPPPRRILLTHAHADHFAGIEEIRSLVKDVEVCGPAGDAEMLSDPVANLSMFVGLPADPGRLDRMLRPGQIVWVGRSVWRVLDTSGHTPGGISFYCRQAATVIVGDTLFAGGIGRYDLPGASFQRLRDNIRANLFALPPETRVVPGHGPETTIEVEKSTNPFLLAS
jgi:glyoxylase-like metal-dependent hydrolase (beta-lactamase superfamily II)